MQFIKRNKKNAKNREKGGEQKEINDYQSRYEKIKREFENKKGDSKNDKRGKREDKADKKKSNGIDRIIQGIRTIAFISIIGAAFFVGDKFKVYTNFQREYSFVKNRIEYVLSDNLYKKGDGFLYLIDREFKKQGAKSSDYNSMGYLKKEYADYLSGVVDSLLDYLSPIQKKSIIEKEVDKNYETYQFGLKKSLIEKTETPSDAYFIIERMIPKLDKEGIESVIYSCINERFGSKATKIIDEMNTFYYEFDYNKPTKKQIDWGGN